MAKKSSIRGWKFLIFVVLLFCGLAVLGRGGRVPEAFAKAQAMDQAEPRAKDSGLPVLVFVRSDSSDQCESYSKGALKDKGVAKWITENTLPVVADLSDGASPDAARFGVSAVPTLVLVRDGKEVARLEGKVKTAVLLDWLAEHSGPIADWKYKNPGKELPDITVAPRRMSKSRNDIPVNHTEAAPATPAR